MRFTHKYKLHFIIHQLFRTKWWQSFFKLYALILSSYLHSCEPPIIHGNLTCDTIFIQHNGLIKIGSGRDRLKKIENKIRTV